jgi:thiamine kinase-like enzyme
MESKMEQKIVGFGRTSDVYEYGTDCVLKLFKEGIDIETVETEYNLSKYVYAKGVPTPKPKEILHYNNRIGITFQKISGKTLLKVFLENVFKIYNNISKMAELQNKINQIIIENNGYTFKKYLKCTIINSKYLTEVQKKFMGKYINQLPDGINLCHGDFHPENILVFNGNFYIIDWMTGMQGPIAADVARTEMILKNAEIPDDLSFFRKYLISIAQGIVAKLYVKKYCKISGIKISELSIWKLPLYIARLDEKNSKMEEERILKKIKKELEKRQTSA